MLHSWLDHHFNCDDDILWVSNYNENHPFLDLAVAKMIMIMVIINLLSQKNPNNFKRFITTIYPSSWTRTFTNCIKTINSNRSCKSSIGFTHCNALCDKASEQFMYSTCSSYELKISLRKSEKVDDSFAFWVIIKFGLWAIIISIILCHSREGCGSFGVINDTIKREGGLMVKCWWPSNYQTQLYIKIRKWGHIPQRWRMETIKEQKVQNT